MKLALGTVQFGLDYGIANQTGQVTRPEAKKMLQLAAANGIDTLDTAIAYGESETCLGEVGVQDFKVVTKLPPVPVDCTDISDWVQEQVLASLDRLGAGAVYGLLLHRSDQLLGGIGKKLYRALQALKDKGVVQKVGISIYSPHELETIPKHVRLDLVQAPFNLIDRRLYTTGWLSRLKNDGVEVHSRSVFLQGLLLMSKVAMPPKFAPWSELWERWFKWLSVYDVSPVQACLAFPLGFPEIDRVVVGADNINQLEQIIGFAGSRPAVELPDLHCDAEDLVNPSRWSRL
ncbi:MAG: aldo/keto reductase [Proteobacteria bacterium]|nr:aldo/keto reductase [Pseudomonadota bacterium]